MGRLIPAGTGMEYYRNIRLTEAIVPEEAPASEADIEADLLSTDLNIEALKSKRVDLG
jgi:hypothetical protein